MCICGVRKNVCSCNSRVCRQISRHIRLYLVPVRFERRVSHSNRSHTYSPGFTCIVSNTLKLEQWHVNVMAYCTAFLLNGLYELTSGNRFRFKALVNTSFSARQINKPIKQQPQRRLVASFEFPHHSAWTELFWHFAFASIFVVFRMLNGVNERWPNTILRRRLTISICLLHFLYMHESGFESADNESTIVNSAQRNTQYDRNRNRKEEKKLCAIFWFCLHRRRHRSRLVLVCGCSYSYVHRLDILNYVIAPNTCNLLQHTSTHTHSA